MSDAMFERLECIGCCNNDCEYFGLYNGCLMCSYCLEDWLENNPSLSIGRFDEWLIKQRAKMRKDRGEK